MGLSFLKEELLVVNNPLNTIIFVSLFTIASIKGCWLIPPTQELIDFLGREITAQEILLLGQVPDGCST